jgi:hypothetical protein
MRGAGDLLGTRQSGFGIAQFGHLIDSHLVDLVQREARIVFDRDPTLQEPENALLAQLVNELVVEYGEGDIS